MVRTSVSRAVPSVVPRFVLSETVELPSGTECRDGSVRLNGDGTFTYFYTRTLVAAEYTGVTEYTADGTWEWRATTQLVCAPLHGARSRTESHTSGSSHAAAEWGPQLVFDVVHPNPVTLLLRYKARNGAVESRVFVKRGPGEEVPTSPVRPRRGTPAWRDLAGAADEYVEAQATSDGDDSGSSSAGMRREAWGERDGAGAGGGVAVAGHAAASTPPASDVSGAGVSGSADVVGRYVYHETVPYEVGTGSADGEVVFHTDGRFNYSYTRTREDKHYSGTTQRTAAGTYEVSSPGCVVCHPSLGRRKKVETYARDKPKVETGTWKPDLTFYSVRRMSPAHTCAPWAWLATRMLTTEPPPHDGPCAPHAGTCGRRRAAGAVPALRDQEAAAEGPAVRQVRRRTRGARRRTRRRAAPRHRHTAGTVSRRAASRTAVAPASTPPHDVVGETARAGAAAGWAGHAGRGRRESEGESCDGGAPACPIE